MDNIGTRIQELISALGLNAVQFAESIGEDPSKISSYKNGKYKPGAVTLTNMLVKYKNLNINWVLLGKGEMWNREMSIINDVDQNSQYNVKKPPDKPPCEETEKALLTKDEQVSKLILQSEKLINIIDRHSITIQNLSVLKGPEESPKEKLIIGGNVPKNVQG